MNNSPAVPSAGTQPALKIARASAPMSHGRVLSCRHGHRDIPAIPIDIPLHAGVSDRAVQPATRWDIGHTGRDSTSGSGPLVPILCPRRFPENVPSSFRGVPSTRMRHTIGQARNRPTVRNPVDSPVSRTACPFLGPVSRTACPFLRPVSRTACPFLRPLSHRMGPVEDNGTSRPERPPPCDSRVPCLSQALPVPDNGKRIGTPMRQRPRISSASKKSRPPFAARPHRATLPPMIVRRSEAGKHCMLALRRAGRPPPDRRRTRRRA